MSNDTLAHSDDWVDVVENWEIYKDIYKLPTPEQLDELAPRDTVKISNGFERFYVVVKSVSGDTVHGIINNHLVGHYDYDHGDVVRFEKRNVFSIKKHTPMNIDEKNTRRMIRLLGGQQNEDAHSIIAIVNGIKK